MLVRDWEKRLDKEIGALYLLWCCSDPHCWCVYILLMIASRARVCLHWRRALEANLGDDPPLQKQCTYFLGIFFNLHLPSFVSWLGWVAIKHKTARRPPFSTSHPAFIYFPDRHVDYRLLSEGTGVQCLRSVVLLLGYIFVLPWGLGHTLIFDIFPWPSVDGSWG